MKPMLAGKCDPLLLDFPVLASPKLDGIRAFVLAGRLQSRKLIEIPNNDLKKLLSWEAYEGLDGELVVGPPTAKNVFNITTRDVMTHDGQSAAVFHVFDDFTSPYPFEDRLRSARDRIGPLGKRATLVKHQLIHSIGELDDFEESMLALGYEGIMVRDPKGPYKYGRSTTKEGFLLKLKRFEDSEAVVIGVEEEMHNTNEALSDNLGHTKRSKVRSGLIGKGTMGALVVRDVNSGVEFNIGSGFSASDRKRTDWVGKVVKYKYFPVGTLHKPRHPVFIGIRED